MYYGDKLFWISTIVTETSRSKRCRVDSDGEITNIHEEGKCDAVWNSKGMENIFNNNVFGKLIRVKRSKNCLRSLNSKISG